MVGGVSGGRGSRINHCFINDPLHTHPSSSSSLPWDVPPSPPDSILRPSSHHSLSPAVRLIPQPLPHPRAAITHRLSPDSRDTMRSKVAATTTGTDRGGGRDGTRKRRGKKAPVSRWRRWGGRTGALYSNKDEIEGKKGSSSSCCSSCSSLRKLKLIL